MAGRESDIRSWLAVVNWQDQEVLKATNQSPDKQSQPIDRQCSTKQYESHSTYEVSEGLIDFETDGGPHYWW